MDLQLNIVHNISATGRFPLPDKCVHTCITSPPYYGLRDYGTGVWIGGDQNCDHSTAANIISDATSSSTLLGGKNNQIVSHASRKKQKGICKKCGAIRIDEQLGMEKTPEQYVKNMVKVFREVKRVLRDDGTLWLNIGDSYCSTAPGSMGDGLRQSGILSGVSDRVAHPRKKKRPATPKGMKPKDLMGIPWMVAFALRADGWYLRQDIIWHKPNPMPESVTDRCTKAHEYIFLLSKSAKYYYDHEAIKTIGLNPVDDQRRIADVNSDHKSTPDELNNGLRHRTSLINKRHPRNGVDTKGGNQGSEMGIPTYASAKARGHVRAHQGFNENWDGMSCRMSKEEQLINGANKRSVWTVATKPFSEAHFATFPPELIVDCIRAGCPEISGGGGVLYSIPSQESIQRALQPVN